LRSGAIAVELQLGPVLNQGAGCMSKFGSAGIAVQFWFTLDHESGCRNVYEGTLRRITGYRIAIRLYLEQNASSAKTVTKK
jgi:hypothetical protein